MGTFLLSQGLSPVLLTMAKKAEVDQFAIKYIVGHKINDITECVYTKESRMVKKRNKKNKIGCFSDVLVRCTSNV